METVEVTPEEELTQATDQRQEYRALLKLPAWDLLVSITRAQAEHRLSDVLSPASGLDSLIKMEYEKGVRAGMLMMIQLPERIIEALDQDIETLAQQIGDFEDAT